MSEPTIDNKISWVSSRIALTHGRWVSKDDISQELWLYYLDFGKKDLNKAIDKDDWARVNRLLFARAHRYAEEEKAHQCGYAFEDVAWYRPEQLYDLLPMALDASWEGLTGESGEEHVSSSNGGREGGSLLAMVVDVRRALGSAMSWATVDDFDPKTEIGMERLVALADKLGGEFPNSPGYDRGRKSITNSKAKSMTEKFA